jgi:hypothetical protein
MECRKDHQKDEDIVDRQRLLDDIAGEEFQRLLIGNLAPRRTVQPKPEQGIEHECQAHPYHAPSQRFAH